MSLRLLQTYKPFVVFAILVVNGLLLYKFAQSVSNEYETDVEDNNELSKQKDGKLSDVHKRSDSQVETVERESQDSVSVPYSGASSTPPLILYNRVPKTGSTTFANIAYKLTETNGFHMLHLNVTYKNSHYLNILDQKRFVSNISEWREKQPAIYHGHMRYLDFTRFGYPNPIYINIIRDPVDRLVSYYYFLRNGDDFRPKLKRASSKDTATTLDECLVIGGKDCDLERIFWLQVPFFCGQSDHCMVVGEWALEQAKTNLLNHYLLVGITEQLEDFIALLEALLPEYFSGALDLYTNTEMGHLRKTKNKKPLSDKSLDIIHESAAYQLEYRFYTFAKDQFNFLKQRTMIRLDDGRIKIQPPEFKYEKIFPKEL